MLRERRKELNLTQKQLAEMLGREQSYIARVENGKADINCRASSASPPSSASSSSPPLSTDLCVISPPPPQHKSPCFDVIRSRAIEYRIRFLFLGEQRFCICCEFGVNHDASAVFAHNHFLVCADINLLFGGMRLKQPPQALRSTTTIPRPLRAFLRMRLNAARVRSSTRVRDPWHGLSDSPLRYESRSRCCRDRLSSR